MNRTRNRVPAYRTQASPADRRREVAPETYADQQHEDPRERRGLSFVEAITLLGLITLLIAAIARFLALLS